MGLLIIAITYTFTATGDTTVAFIYTWNNTTSTATLTVSVNGGTATTVPTTSINAYDAYLITPYVITNTAGGVKLTVNRFNRNGPNSQDEDSYAYVHASGTYTGLIPFTKTYDKSIVYLRNENYLSYDKVSAFDANFTINIYYPTGANGYMFSAYAEITDYVRQYGLGIIILQILPFWKVVAGEPVFMAVGASL